jgi:hypothetical protein
MKLLNIIQDEDLIREYANRKDLGQYVDELKETLENVEVFASVENKQIKDIMIVLIDQTYHTTDLIASILYLDAKSAEFALSVEEKLKSEFGVDKVKIAGIKINSDLLERYELEDKAYVKIYKSI